MESIRVINLRCLEDTGAVEIKPISLLVGANSSGKSSFIRLFPLLRQSSETQTLSGLLLNEGDVNFGFFDEAIHRHADPAELGLEFTLILKKGIHHGADLNKFLKEPLKVTCAISYAKRARDPHYPYLRLLRLRLHGQSQADLIELTADESGKIIYFKVNNYDALQDASPLKLKVGRGIIPHLSRSLEDDAEGENSPIEVFSEMSLFQKRLLSQTRSLFHGKTGADTMLAALRQITIGSISSMLSSVKNDVPSSSWKRKVEGWNIEDAEFIKLRNLLLARGTGELLTSIGLHVTELARSVNYFAPVRASVERDYLSRDVGVGSVDPAGQNVAMVLDALPPAELASFRTWMQKHFGFDIFPKRVADGARIALRMREEDSSETFNLADMGFGFSQMLPFLVQIWSISDRPLNRSSRHFLRRFNFSNAAIDFAFIVAIEQPELHLHPALQAKLADVFVTAANLSKEKGFPIKFFLETHSPTIIERIGALVEAGRISNDDVQLLLFEKRSEATGSDITKVTSTKYNSDGILENWPFGFLSAPYDALLSSSEEVKDSKDLR